MKNLFFSCFWGTLSFFSRLPIPHRTEKEGNTFLLCPGFFPVAGLAIGAVLGLAWGGLVSVPPLLSSVSIVILWTVLTGGIHWDGWADTWETALSGQNIEDKERIRKDPHLGTFGVLSLVLGLFLKTSLLGTFFYSPGEIVLIAVWARGILPLLLVLAHRFHPSIPLSRGLGGTLFSWMTSVRVGSATILTFLLVFFLSGTRETLILAASFPLILVPASWALRKQDALSGDFMGFSVEFLEITSLAVLGEMTHTHMGTIFHHPF
ncbi:MAG: adenosylcobinamide-GDP ribazoletransferase [Leptospirales bacterium]